MVSVVTETRGEGGVGVGVGWGEILCSKNIYLFGQAVERTARLVYNVTTWK